MKFLVNAVTCKSEPSSSEGQGPASLWKPHEARHPWMQLRENAWLWSSIMGPSNLVGTKKDLLRCNGAQAASAHPPAESSHPRATSNHPWATSNHPSMSNRKVKAIYCSPRMKLSWILQTSLTTSQNWSRVSKVKFWTAKNLKSQWERPSKRKRRSLTAWMPKRKQRMRSGHPHQGHLSCKRGHRAKIYLVWLRNRRATIPTSGMLSTLKARAIDSSEKDHWSKRKRNFHLRTSKSQRWVGRAKNFVQHPLNVLHS